MIDARFVITGSTGLVGSAFARALAGAEVVPINRDVLWPIDPTQLRRLIGDIRPAVVINCAADTDVEAAETAPELAQAVNATLAGALATAAADQGAAFVHFSSTGCYGAWKSEPYRESDPLCPTTVHHVSKAIGEDLVARSHPAPLIVRLGWVFGGTPGQRRNFVWARLLEAHGKANIGSNALQTGSPTFSDDVVTQTLALLAAGQSGVFNCVNEGTPVSRLEYVAAILQAAGFATRVLPVEFARRAPVSPNESAMNARLAETYCNLMPDWSKSLADHVGSLIPAFERKFRGENECMTS